MEFRCAAIPGKYGEMMVMRFLNSNADMLSLDTLIGDKLVRQNFVLSLMNPMELLSFQAQLDPAKVRLWLQLYERKTAVSSRSLRLKIQWNMI